jgi:hypothetical protein
MYFIPPIKDDLLYNTFCIVLKRTVTFERDTTLPKVRTIHEKVLTLLSIEGCL